jgi:hypothetical protein
MPPPDPIDEPVLALDDGLVLPLELWLDGLDVEPLLDDVPLDELPLDDVPLDDPMLLLPLPEDMRAFVRMKSPPRPELPVRSLALPAVAELLGVPLALELPLLDPLLLLPLLPLLLLPLLSPDFRQPVTVTLPRSLSRPPDDDDDDDPVAGVCCASKTPELRQAAAMVPKSVLVFIILSDR